MGGSCLSDPAHFAEKEPRPFPQEKGRCSAPTFFGCQAVRGKGFGHELNFCSFSQRVFWKKETLR